MKKPAKAICKKPAGPDKRRIDLTDIFAKLHARKAHMDHKGFTSMAYHHAMKLALKSGCSDDDAKSIARDALGKASAMYSKKG